MSKIKRAMSPELYQLIDDVKACEHLNFDEYFERCEDCNMTIEEMPQSIQDAYYACIEEEDAEAQAEQAENYRDSLREDGIHV